MSQPSDKVSTSSETQNSVAAAELAVLILQVRSQLEAEEHKLKLEREEKQQLILYAVANEDSSTLYQLVKTPEDLAFRADYAGDDIKKFLPKKNISPLELAIYGRSDKMIEILLKMGAKVHGEGSELITIKSKEKVNEKSSEKARTLFNTLEIAYALLGQNSLLSLVSLRSRNLQEIGKLIKLDDRHHQLYKLAVCADYNITRATLEQKVLSRGLGDKKFISELYDGPYGMTLAMAAILGGSYDLAKCLLKLDIRQLDPNYFPGFGLPKCELDALVLASLGGNPKIFDLVLVNIKNLKFGKGKKEKDSVKEATEKQVSEKEVLEKEVSIKDVSAAGPAIDLPADATAEFNKLQESLKAAFFTAIKCERLVILKYFLHLDAKWLYQRSKEGMTPLIAAIHARKRSVIELFIKQESEKGSDKIFEMTNASSDTPLMAAIESKMTALAKMIFLKYPAMLSAVNDEGQNAIMLAIEHENMELLRLFLQADLKGTLLKSQDKQGRMPLHYAATSSDPNIFKIVIHELELKYSDSAFDMIFSSDGRGYNILHIAAEVGRQSIIEMLLKNPELGDIFLCSLTQDGKSKNVLQIAIQANRTWIVDYLIGKYPKLLEQSDAAGKQPLIAMLGNGDLQPSALDSLERVIYPDVKQILQPDCRKLLQKTLSKWLKLEEDDPSMLVLESFFELVMSIQSNAAFGDSAEFNQKTLIKVEAEIKHLSERAAKREATLQLQKIELDALKKEMYALQKERQDCLELLGKESHDEVQSFKRSEYRSETRQNSIEKLLFENRLLKKQEQEKENKFNQELEPQKMTEFPPLYQAVMDEDHETLKSLIAKGEKVLKVQGCLPALLELARKHDAPENILRLLSETALAEINPRYIFDDRFEGVLKKAFLGDVAALSEAAVKNKIMIWQFSVNELQAFGLNPYLNPLCAAVLGGAESAVEYLLSINLELTNSVPMLQKPDPHWPYISLTEILGEAGFVPVADRLIKFSLRDVSSKSARYLFELNKAVFKAIIFGNLDMLQYLQARDSTCLYHRTQDGSSTLMIAISKGNLPVFKYLMNVQERDKILIGLKAFNGADAFMIAAQHNQVEMMRLLLEQNPKFLFAKTTEGATALMIAAEANAVDAIQFILKEAKACNRESEWIAATSFRKTAAEFAAAKGNLKALQLIISCDPGYQSILFGKPDYSILHLAAKGGYLDMVEFLLNVDELRDFLLYSKTAIGATVLHIAVKAGQMAIVQYLIDHYPALLLIPDDTGNAPLISALCYDYSTKRKNIFPIVKYILAEDPLQLTLKNHEKLVVVEVDPTYSSDIKLQRFLTGLYERLLEMIQNSEFTSKENFVLYSKNYQNKILELQGATQRLLGIVKQMSSERQAIDLLNSEIAQEKQKLEVLRQCFRINLATDGPHIKKCKIEESEINGSHVNSAGTKTQSLVFPGSGLLSQRSLPDPKEIDAMDFFDDESPRTKKKKAKNSGAKARDSLSDISMSLGLGLSDTASDSGKDSETIKNEEGAKKGAKRKRE